VHTIRSSARLAALILSVSASFATAVEAQVNQYGNPLKHPPAPTTGAITPEELRTRLYIFADDSMQGRAVGRIGNMVLNPRVTAGLSSSDSRTCSGNSPKGRR
jgi:hypothetical protein